jgi:carboxyl-terminal processing protease
MRPINLSRKWLTTLVLVVVIALAGSTSLVYLPSSPVEAQGSQPGGTEDLFKPFWEVWDLLHQNYVDPLDDNVLVEGARDGMIKALDDASFEAPTPEPPAETATTDERFVPFWETWTLIHETHTSPDDNALMEGAINGMMETLGDPHSGYMDPETFAMVNAGMSGEYEGIGATVRKDEKTGGLELVSIFEGSPAEQAGLQPTDQIVRVEGKDITELTQEEGIALVRGPAGTPVRLGILRVGEADILKFEVLRGKIVVPSIESKVLEGNIGYVRLSQFEFSTAPDLRVALQNIDANNLDGLIIDVRGNPGGYLTTVIDVASAFIPDGNIVLERTPNNETEHPALGNAIAADVPMVILVDQGSASASELLAGALQDHHRATVVGMQTFGKGSVQSWFELTNGGGVRITISRWYTPDGHSVSEVGIQPDVVVEYVPDENADNQLEAAIQVLQGTYQPIVNQPSPR